MFSYFLAICPNQKVGVNLFIVFGIVMFLCVTIKLFKVLFFPSRGTVYRRISMFYRGFDGVFLIFLGVFLLVALIRVVKVVRLSQGPLRPFVNWKKG